MANLKTSMSIMAAIYVAILHKPIAPTSIIVNLNLKTL